MMRIETLRRRNVARVPVDTMCSAITGEREELGLLVDVSEHGVRVERPLGAATPGRVVQLELMLPDVDEIIWAKGEICFDQLWRMPIAPGVPGVTRGVRTSGVRLVAGATRHLKLLRDWVFAARDALSLPRAIDRRDTPWRALDLAACWRG